MRLGFVILILVAAVVDSCDASSLRHGVSAQDINDPILTASSEERRFKLSSGPITKVEPIKISLRDKILNALAKCLLPSADNCRFVYKNGRWHAKRYY
ncbi:unnamed protein product [Phytophthora lilii]|uniref:Unnamed protein product n=1 Tax=Phytophthora lilii TaxID=2077276 RepID=A0A9W6THB3_9STRA|nr:unnamed protein product [Phytophthora lilii]